MTVRARSARASAAATRRATRPTRGLPTSPAVKAAALTASARTAVTALAALAALATVPACAAREPADLPDPATFERQLLDQINAVRIGANEPRLDDNQCLADHARERATQLLGADALPPDDLPTECTEHTYTGENVSRSDLPAAEVVAIWAADDLQYPNLVDPGFTVAGVGCVTVALDDPRRTAAPGDATAGMACSVIFQGPGQ